ncbi:MAG: POTRA domain-containing protein [Polyangiaceae bacterium]
MLRRSHIRPIGRFAPAILGLLFWANASWAQQGSAADPLGVRPNADLASYSGKPVGELSLVSTGKWFKDVPVLRWVKVGDPFSPSHLRSSVRDLLDSGRYANVEIEAYPMAGDRVGIRIAYEPRRVVISAEVHGAALPAEEVLEQVGIKAGGEMADHDLWLRTEAIRMLHVQRGYPAAKVRLSVVTADDPLGVSLVYSVDPGAAVAVAHRRFEVAPDPRSPGLREALSTYSVATGARYDEPSLLQADRALMVTLRNSGWHEANVTHVAQVTSAGVEIRILVRAGPKVSVNFEGNVSFDNDRLLEILDLQANENRSIEGLAERIRRHYVGYGFLDALVTPKVAEENPSERVVTFEIIEGQVVRVARREYPCLEGERTADDISAEIDSFLAEELPGAELLGAVEPSSIDEMLGPKSTTGARPSPLDPNPYATYSARVYERAMKHVQDLYRSEGYLSATVGPATLRRRRCAKNSQPGECRAIEPAPSTAAQCLTDAQGLLIEDPPRDPGLGCTPDPKRGRYCEASLVLEIPIKLGPRTELWDVAFDGDQRLTELQLGHVSELELGAPLSLAEVEQARRRVLDEYTERGFAYADVVTQVDTSPDKSRGRVRFSIREGEQVKVGSIIVKGATSTSEALIRSRIALERGKPYRRSLVRATEERLGNLGVFSTVRVGLEDPYVPAREKNVVVEVTERVPQYLDLRGGFSTGEGPRGIIDFGNLNVGGKAIQFALRVRLGYLPDALILEPDVRAKYESDVKDPWQRLERTISLSATFPDIGLGPLFRLGVEAFDVHDNARDFALTKDAAVSNLSFLATRRLTFQAGTSLERNNVRIFGRSDQEEAIADYVSQNPGRSVIFRVPAGTTGVLAERLTVNWDRRDMPFDAHRGTLVTSTLEHVTAKPLYSNKESSDSPFRATDSEFLRFSSRVAGYIPLSKRGTTLALSFRFGLTHQLVSGSRTYPDRLFFMGGIDTVRGFLQDSMIPEDVARQIIGPNHELTVEQVLIRGGNFFVNPRAELRMPVRSVFQTVLFLDAGNLWSRSPTEPKVKLTADEISAGKRAYEPNYLRLRYAVGTGLRVETPIGPLVFDYGFNVERVLDKMFPSRKSQRVWEDLGAFHFTIGLF